MKSDKRKHKRFPVIKDIAEPVDLTLMEQPPRTVPAVLTNLSAGGMSLVVFAHVIGGAKLKISLDIPGLHAVELKGHVAWTSPKGDTTAIGVAADQTPHEFTSRINHMAEDFQDCDLKLSFGVKDVCFRQCHYWELCAKPVKITN